jgi:two-component system chemotaxis response regulator CheB
MPQIEVVAIGVSTGGPVVLERVIEALPPTFPVPIVIVQHMPAVFTKILAERIDAKSAVKVREAGGGELLTPGTVWVAPGGLHLKVRRTKAGAELVLDNGDPENSCKPAVDVLFRSVASAFGGHALALVLTGMGRDGTRGAQAIVDAGGVCLAQDEATSTVWGMPGSVAHQDLASALVPLEDLVPAIESVVARTAWSGLVGQTA